MQLQRPSSAEDAVARSEPSCHPENGSTHSTSQTHSGMRYQRNVCAVLPKVRVVCRRSEKWACHPLGSRISCQQTCGFHFNSGSDSSVCLRNSCGCAARKSPDVETCHLGAARGQTIQPLRKARKSVSAPSTCGSRLTEAASQSAVLYTSLPLEGTPAGANQRGPAAPSPTPLCELGTMQKDFDAARPSWMGIDLPACSVSDISASFCSRLCGDTCQSLTSSGCCGARSPTDLSSFDVWSCESGKKTSEGNNAKLAGVRNSRKVSRELSASIQTKDDLKRQLNDEGSSLLEKAARQRGGNKRTENVSILKSFSASLKEQPFSHIEYINDLLEPTEAQGRSGNCITATPDCCGRDSTSSSEGSQQVELGLDEKVAAWDPSQEDNYALSAPGELELNDFDISDPRRPPSPVRHEDAPPPTAKACIPTSSNAQRATKAVPATCTDLGIYEDMEWFTEASASHATPNIATGASGAVLMSTAVAEAPRHFETPAKQSRAARPGRQPGFHCALATIETSEAFSAGSPTSHSHVADGGGKRVARLGTVQGFSEDGTQAELPSGTFTPDDYSPVDSPQSELSDASSLSSSCTTNFQLPVTGVEEIAAENGGGKESGRNMATNGTGMHRRRGDTKGHGKKTKDEIEDLALVSKSSHEGQGSISDRTSTEPETAIVFAMGR